MENFINDNKYYNIFRTLLTCFKTKKDLYELHKIYSPKVYNEKIKTVMTNLVDDRVLNETSINYKKFINFINQLIIIQYRDDAKSLIDNMLSKTSDIAQKNTIMRIIGTKEYKDTMTIGDFRKYNDVCNYIT